MAFLTINGVDVPVLDGSADLSVEDIGHSARAFNGYMSNSIRARARVIACTTPILSAADARALVGLVRGDGHFWAFSDAYSSRGLGVLSGTYTVSGGNIVVTSGSNARFDTNVGSAWSLLVRYNTGSATYTLDSAGTKYKNGATTTDTVSNIADVTSGDLLLYGRNISGVNGNQAYSYAAVVPYVFTTAMHAAFSASSSPFQSELPRLTVSGSAFRSDSLTMRLRQGSFSEEPVQYMSGGSIAVGYQLSFTLEETL